jgi:hypothetical protein
VDTTLAGLCVSQGRLNLYNAILEIKAPWITIVPEEGIIGPGNSIDVNVTFDALELDPGVYEADIVIISNDPYSPKIIPVTMTVNPDDLQVIPVEGFESSGTRGGPFTPKCMTYTLTNNGPAPVSWTTYETEDWLQVEPNEGVLDPSDSIDADVCITSDANMLNPNIYNQLLIFENTNSGSIKQRQVTLTVKPPDCFTESFDGGNNDLDFLSLTFSPDGTAAYYEACREKVEEFPTDPNGGTYIPLGDDDFAEVILSGDANILFYGIRYNRFYIGSNGYITLGQGDTEFSASLENHFNMPRISALFTDLTPAGSQSISYKQLQDRVAVTFKNVPLYGDKTAKNSFQVEMFFIDGTICVSWLDLSATSGVAGLSEGYGLPPQFIESDLSEYVPCWPLGDFNRDYYVDMFDLAMFVSHWLEEDCGIPYWCEKTDLDFSGITELADYAIFAENWLTIEDWWLRPISHWKFDEGSGTIAYDSVGNNDGTLIGDPCWVAGKIGSYALDFDGSGDYVSVGNAVTHNLAKGTFTAWVFPADLSSVCGGYNFAYVIGANNYTGGELGFRVNGDGSGWASVQNTVSGGALYYPAGSISVGSWHLVAMTWDGSYWKIYVNGVQKDSKSFPQGTSNASNTALIAKGWDGCSWNGKIDDVRIYNRALSAEEIWQLYREGLGPKAFAPNPADGAKGADPNTVLSWSPGKDADSHDVYFGTDFDDVNDATPDSNEYMGNYDVNAFDPCGLNLHITYYWRIDERSHFGTAKGDVWSFTTWVAPNFIGWWKFDEGSGSIAYDSAGDNDGTIYGATWTTGQINGALSFDGVNDYVDCGSDSSLNVGGLSSSYSVSAWFKTVATTQKLIVSKKASADTGLMPIFLDINGAVEGQVRFAVRDSDGIFRAIETSASTYNDGNWHHAVGIRDTNADEIKIIIDGNNITSEQDLTDSSMAVNAPFYIGVMNNPGMTAYFDGTIDDVRVYDRALSAEEIFQLYREGLGPKAFAPNPADGATDVDPNTVLSWSPGKGALSHDVYFGTDYSEVNDANTFSPEYKGNQDVNNWDPCGLNLNTTYYWRIDEVNGPSIYKGDVWSFITWAEFDPNLASWWKFDEGSGTIAYDSAGDNDGTITGATWTTGQINGALSFDGSSDYVTVGDKSSLEQQVFTLSFWGQLNNPSGSFQGGIAKGYIFGSSTEYSYKLDFHNGYANASITNTSNTGFVITGLIVNSDWHMWSMTIGGGTITLYKDGAFVNSTGYTGNIDYTKSHNNFMIGARDSGSYSFNGKIDDVRFYNRVLSAGEIWQLYQNGLNSQN